MKGPRILVATFVAIYLAFIAWYGGHGTPLASGEADALLAQIHARASNDAAPDGRLFEELKQLVASDDGNEFFMLNLINYRAKALYPAGSGYGDDPLEADARYNRAIAPFLLKHGGVPVFLGTPQGRFIDEAGDTQWQRVAIVRYRSKRDLLEMVLDLAGQNVAVHKWASIEKTQVFPVKALFSFVSVRGAVGVAFLALGLLLHFALRAIPAYRGRP